MGEPEVLREIVRNITRYLDTFLPRPSEVESISQRGIAREVLTGIAVALDGTAMTLERARSGDHQSPIQTEGGRDPAVMPSAPSQKVSRPSGFPSGVKEGEA